MLHNTILTLLCILVNYPPFRGFGQWRPFSFHTCTNTCMVLAKAHMEYTAERLLSFKHFSESSVKCDQPLISSLRDLGLFRRNSTRRQRRAGSHIIRKIPVVSPSRKESTPVHLWPSWLRPESRNFSCLRTLPKQTPSCNNVPTLVKCLMLNTQSIRNKTTELLELVEEQEIDIVFVTETWLAADKRDDAFVAELTQPGFVFENFPRGTSSSGGGIGVLLKSGIRSKAVCSKPYKTFEWIEVNLSNRVKVILVYRPPPSAKNKLTSSGFLRDFSDLLEMYATETVPLVITGDINVKTNRPEDLETKRYTDILATYGFSQIIDKPTHRSGNTLDHIITRPSADLVQTVRVDPLIAISDHYPVLFELSGVMRDATHKRNLQKVRKLRKINMDSFALDIQGQLEVTSDMDNPVLKYNTVMTSLVDKHAPMTTIRLKGTNSKPWYNDEIHDARKVRRRLERLFRKSGLEVHRQMFIDQSKAVVSLIQRTRSAYMRQKLSTCNTKDMFRLVNNLLSNNQKSKLPDLADKDALVNKFATFFDEKIASIRKDFGPALPAQMLSITSIECSLASFQVVSSSELEKIIRGSPNKSCELDPLPTWLLRDDQVLKALMPLLTRCVNDSIMSGHVPDCLKRALVTPILKKPNLDCNILKNYRPISNLPFLSKVMEKVIAKQLVSYMNANGLNDPLQSAYKAGHSTETALLKIKADIDTAVDAGKGVILILLDMSAAFDTISHEILLYQLEHRLGVRGSALSWIRSYLANRTQTVNIQGVKSSPVPLVSGVPQGSVLGPLLFSIYIRSLGEEIDSHSMNRHGFADDAQLYDFFETTKVGLATAITKAEKCISTVRKWFKPNHLKGNDDKTEFMIIASKRKLSNLRPLPSIQIGSTAIAPATHVRNLGAIFDEHMSMSTHVSKVVQSVHFQIHRLSKLRRCMNEATCARVLNALVTSRLDFQGTLLLGLPNCELDKLQKAQNAAARLLKQTRKRDHITPVLRDLHWLPVSSRIEYRVLLVIHKVLHQRDSPAYLRELLSLHTSGRQLRSSSVPFTLNIQRTSGAYGDRSLCVLAARLWNDLPARMRELTDTPTFKKVLKTHIFKRVFTS